MALLRACLFEVRGLHRTRMRPGPKEHPIEPNLPSPVENGDSHPYWAAARDRRLVIRKCKACGETHFMPRHLCPTCWSDQLDWIEAKGTGHVYSYTVIRRAPMTAFAPKVPYVIALIELDEGPRMVANVLGDDALHTKIGDRVKVVFEERDGGAMVPQFVHSRAAA